MVSKCTKCGTDIPDGAAFCPNCGVPKASVQQTPPPQQYQSNQNVGGNSMEDMAKTLFSRKFLIIGLTLGVLLLIIASFMIEFTEPAVWEDNHVEHFAAVLRTISYSGMGLLLICVGLLNETFNKYYRLGMIIAGGLILG